MRAFAPRPFLSFPHLIFTSILSLEYFAFISSLSEYRTNLPDVFSSSLIYSLILSTHAPESNIISTPDVESCAKAMLSSQFVSAISMTFSFPLFFILRYRFWNYIPQSPPHTRRIFGFFNASSSISSSVSFLAIFYRSANFTSSSISSIKSFTSSVFNAIS